MREEFLLMWEAFVRAVIRFWDNRFIQDDEVEYLRLQINKMQFENQRLLNKLIGLNSPVSDSDESDEEKKPITPKYVPWALRKQQLEKESLEELERMVLEKNGKSNE